ncbi:MAG: hypothetical protein CVU18_07115 [Betaproteobacteria bacterium HGW-Betaproteobacteria-12]|jgi:hypothetical protein|nr:MAG: hypothetical protein CVU18_07115 [Betaproteobacteria bacterium HGW-Betaproteobacteria-12]
MVISTVERRHQQRHQPQQQPQQSEAFPAPAGKSSAPANRESPRRVWQALAEAQAKKQSGKL